MSGSREQMMVEILRELRSEGSGIEAAVLISSDAMPLASDLSDSIDEELLSATASTLIAAGERVARDLSRGDLDQLYLRGEAGDLVVVRVNDHAILACTVDKQSKLGMTLLAVSRCAEKLSEAI